MKRAKLSRRPITLAGPSVLHDRRATDLVIGAQVAPVEVTDPFGDKVIVLQSHRDDPLAGMLHRGHIDKIQEAGGRKWQEYMEAAEIGRVRTNYATTERVDCRQFPEPLSDKAAYAFQQLKKASRELGQIDESIVRDVLMLRLTFMQICAKRHMNKKGDPEHIGKRFRDALNVLAVVFGCATGGRK